MATRSSEVVKVTYSQNWPAYNKAQVSEKRDFVRLLADLVKRIDNPDYVCGRPRLPMRDMVFLHAYRCYVRCSARRFGSDLADAAERGSIESMPTYNSVLNYGASEALTPILTTLIEQSALARFAQVEQDFAADSTGFGTSNLRTWFSQKHKARWLPPTTGGSCTRSMACRRTSLPTPTVVTPTNANDAPFLRELARTTAKGFDVREISADKGYLSRDNLDVIEQLGAAPFVPFKSNSVEPKRGTAWARMYHLFAYRHDEFLAHYHKRSNVESSFMMIKAKFGDTLSTKGETAQVNEILGKVLAHNICCLIQAHYELGLDIDLPRRGLTRCEHRGYLVERTRAIRH